MSLSIKDTRVTVWQYSAKEKFATANLSTSKKDQNGNWTNMYWRAKFVGKAFEKSHGLADKDRIVITNALIEQSKVDDKVYYNLVVFDLENPNESSTNESVILDRGDNELPF